MTDQTPAHEMADGLEEIASWLRANPTVPIHYGSVSLRVTARDDEPATLFIEIARVLADGGTLSFDNALISGECSVRREFAGGAKLRLLAERGVLSEPPPIATPLPPEVLALIGDES
jgi:hypothetical protein